MTLNISYSGCFRLAARETAITRTIDSFRPDLRIDEARVRVERDDDRPYPFRVAARLVTPGPDIEAEGRDYTFEAALRKMGHAVSKALRWRQAKRKREKSLPRKRSRAAA